ncbi:MAG: hypothetical protein R3F59_14335 [Myxococcota bacterium]
MLWTIGLFLAGCSEDVDLDDTGAVVNGDQPLPDDVPAQGQPIVEAYLGGALATLPAFAGVAQVSGQVQLVRRLEGIGQVSIAASGLTPGVEHTAHVHTMPCAYEAGGHYLLDPSVTDGGEDNEIWARMTPDADGNAAAALVVDAPIRGDALSVVIHDPDSGDKLACADLLPEMVVGSTASGSFAPFAYYEAVDETIAGTVSASLGSTSEVELALTGLSATETYAAHVHALPCDALYGGGHYKLDPTVEGTEAYNEIWPEITVGPDGSANASATVSRHQLREDAQAVVLHRTSAPDAPKVACADLQRDAYLPRKTYGPFAPVAGAPSAVAGSASLERRLDGATVLTVSLQAAPGRYPAHLHALPCAVADGGGHYLVDPTTPDAGEPNELWDEVVVGDAGSAERAVGTVHLARAEAQSVVVHDASGARLACADLR